MSLIKVRRNPASGCYNGDILIFFLEFWQHAMESLKLAQLNERRTDLEDQLLELVSQILDELEPRLIEYCEQGAEKIFKAFPEVSSQFDKTRVLQFKRDVQACAKENTARLMGQLADEDYWVEETPSRRPKESLRQNTKVWEAIQTCLLTLVPVFKRYGYPTRTGVLGTPFREMELKEPEQLPRSEHLRLLSMKYWIALGKFQQTHQESLRLQRAVAHQTLEEIWQD